MTTEDFGRRLAGELAAGDIVLLEGDLATGKTVFVRGILTGLGGHETDVSSPTFVLLQTYDCNARGIARLHHVDLYRLADRVGDLREMGMEDVLSDPRAVVAVEWPKETLATWLAADSRVWRVSISTQDDESRLIEIISPEN